ncbi:MAG: DNA replication/repair protein RecF [Alphaproteobacteria bacterium]|nr:DNA replication/repair protein RecF [Alphaproteobacteria bacterium]
MSYISHISLSQFRSYQYAEIKNMASGLVVITGANGAGKTNILEAISLLSPGRGLRSARHEEIQHHPQTPDNTPQNFSPWAVSAVIQTGSSDVQLGTGIDPLTGKRIIRINGVTAKSQTALADYVSCLWLTPQMDRLFMEGASGRRRFFDKLIFTFDPAHAGRVTRYENAMSQRSKLLREGHADTAWLTALESQMSETGVSISAARLEFLGQLQTACDSADIQETHFFPHSRLSLTGTTEELLLRLPAIEVEDMLSYQLAQSRERDAETGGAASGPHKTDFCAVFSAKNMPADQCSTGEQKALLIGIILAHARLMRAEKNHVPILLLDEVSAHLDAQRRQALFDRLIHLGGQVFMTGTDPASFSACLGRAAFLTVSEAKITPQNTPLAA